MRISDWSSDVCSSDLSAFTRNAAEAFAAHTGNCMSLVVLTAAMADELGLDVQFQEVLGDPTMSRNGDLLFYNGHVNVVLREKLAEKGDRKSVGEGKRV